MASASVTSEDLTVEPDLQPLYPTPPQVSHLLSPSVGLSPQQRTDLVSHCLTRACQFGDLQLLSHLLTDPNAGPYVDLGKQDEDGLGLISTIILGFGFEVERDIEREECIRLLISEGCDVNTADKAGWSPLHYAALLSPPTLVSHLLTHGASPFSITMRKLTPLDIVTAHSTIPGREHVALFLEEAMRGEGWKGGRMEEQRRLSEQRTRLIDKRKSLQDDVEKILGISRRWWGDQGLGPFTDLFEEEDEDDSFSDTPFTPPMDYTSMLVFSPLALPDIFQSLITDFKPSLRNTEPANALYMLARFACLNCDHNWLDDLIIGATDAIEETFFNCSEDATALIFWLYNTTVWLHLMRCDKDLNQACEILGSFTLIEEILNSVFVFIIRLAERKIDQLLDAALLDYTPLSTEFESIQFESEWSFLRSFAGGKKKAAANGTSVRNSAPAAPRSPSRPSSPGPPNSASPTNQRGFASIRQTLTRARAPSAAATPLHSLFTDTTPPTPPPPSPKDITAFITALHTLLALSGINPALVVQLWSQVMYWTACETFNRVLTRKKYICRSRAVQISMNLSVLEEWIGEMQLPRGIGSHFAPVKDLLTWLQSLSSITEFPNLIATIQTLRNLNPLQMRRAVRDYRYEVNEPRMTEECNQYLAQMQKDWERHRVKLGVEALRKEIGERERDRDDAVSLSPSLHEDSARPSSSSASSTHSQEMSAIQRNIDALFDRTWEKSLWEPAKAPEPLGELLDSRYMLPLLLPSDPMMLGALPASRSTSEQETLANPRLSQDSTASKASFGSRGALGWHLKAKKLREVGISMLQSIDGSRASVRWTRPVEMDEEEDWEQPPPYTTDDMLPEDGEVVVETRFTPLTRSRSGRNRGKANSAIEEIATPLEEE
ncbi:uncharacterized protein LAESUDRAFT_750281 [Laetiporus sulphureus 93-53]|uniref:Dilute domain-containing protein n=1 Tax=Laetiporus sulphureus 93-53 TaxID=1314785 RepID=A0A165DY16_9APHY|nr:uncharacterized protein LAESUDRAFT_750281 [Laetiporus sulphureus 93-53]KZT05853.1 hypothetical protein LAESUDRAFT_750281 [Laetiporus sulphureus 93-53]